MAAPTNVRVYATSQTSVVLKWSYGGSNLIYVYRSTDGSSYTRVSGAEEVATGTTSYTDSTLEAGTKYWFKLSDDAGSTFSSVVTVYSHSCLSPAGDDNTMILPRTNGKEPTKEFDELAERIESALSGRVLNPSQCVACPEDGAVVIDCSKGCHDWVIIADEDINSVSINWCGEGEGNLEFILPPNISGRKICGFPSGFGFTGDECFQAPLSSGAAGSSMNVGFGGGRGNPSNTKSRPGYNKGIGNGGGTGASCNCVPGANGQLTIKSCNNNNSLNCSGAKKLKLIACGGRAPYTWSKTGSVQLSAASGVTTTVSPAANSGSAVAGNAYAVAKWHRCNGGFNQTHRAVFGCADQVTSAGAATTSNGAFLTAAPACEAFITASDFAIPSVDHSNPACSPNCDGCPNPAIDFAGGNICDMRSAGMISSGCAPCGLAANGSTVTVTDSVGTQVTIVLKS